MILLQNVVVDLLLGLGFNDAFRIFADHVGPLRRRAGLHHHEPAAAARRARRRPGVENPIVCANINKIGFRMSGGIEGYVDALERRPFRAVAMSVFAAGRSRPRGDRVGVRAAQPRVDRLRRFEQGNIASTKALVDEYWSG